MANIETKNGFSASYQFVLLKLVKASQLNEWTLEKLIKKTNINFLENPYFLRKYELRSQLKK